MRHIHVFLILVAVFSQTSCLETRQPVAEVASASTWFEGAKSAKNLGGNPATTKVEWVAAERAVIGYRVYSLLPDPETGLTDWVLLDEVNSETTSYAHSNLASGQMYSYKVKAVGLDDVEDTNNKIVSTVVFEGISNVRITGKTTALVSLNSSTGSFDEVRVYAVPKAGGARKLVGSATGNVATIEATGLRSGTTYRFYVNAYMKYLSAEDGNLSFIEGQTYSDTFGSGDASDSSYAYRGVMNVQAFGLAPNAPSLPDDSVDPLFASKYPTMKPNPKSRLVRLTWLPFTGANSETKYKVLRAANSNIIDPHTTEACTSTKDTSCVVNCTATGGGPKTCEDTDVSAPPKRYDYVITQIKSIDAGAEEWVEELPKENSSDFRISVHIPPDYMVLVQRDSANYEMCTNMGKNPNPRKFQRCEYYGIGASPFNSGPSKPAKTYDYGFYDFGYNFFVDRYRTACNWTRTPGACGNPEGCVGVTATGINTPNSPPPDVGNNGDVFLAVNGYYGSNCYIKSSGAWKALNNNTLLQSEFDAATTIDPGPDGQKHRPVANNLNPYAAFNICQSKSTEYGRKRLMRHREYIVAAAQPRFAGEPNAVPDRLESLSIEHSFVGHTAYECGTNHGLAAPDVSTIAGLLDPANSRGQVTNYSGWGATNRMPHSYVYFTGTQKTIRCQTRHGSQDMRAKETLGMVFSDTFERINATTEYPMKIRGTTSDFDNGNNDMMSYDFGGGTGPSPGTASGTFANALTTSQTATLGTKYIIPMGVPLISWNGITVQNSWNIVDLTMAGLFGGDNIGRGGNDSVYFHANTSTRFYMHETLNSRWGYFIYPDAGSGNISTWCGVEAE